MRYTMATVENPKTETLLPKPEDDTDDSGSESPFDDDETDDGGDECPAPDPDEGTDDGGDDSVDENL
jgi:hypothetical protein